MQSPAPAKACLSLAALCMRIGQAAPSQPLAMELSRPVLTRQGTCCRADSTGDALVPGIQALPAADAAVLRPRNARPPPRQCARPLCSVSADQALQCCILGQIKAASLPAALNGMQVDASPRHVADHTVVQVCSCCMQGRPMCQMRCPGCRGQPTSRPCCSRASCRPPSCATASWWQTPGSPIS